MIDKIVHKINARKITDYYFVPTSKTSIYEFMQRSFDTGEEPCTKDEYVEEIKKLNLSNTSSKYYVQCYLNEIIDDTNVVIRINIEDKIGVVCTSLIETKIEQIEDMECLLNSIAKGLMKRCHRDIDITYWGIFTAQELIDYYNELIE